ncbi:hypothetical protein ACFX15_027726 [Malus domestica]
MEDRLCSSSDQKSEKPQSIFWTIFRGNEIVAEKPEAAVAPKTPPPTPFAPSSPPLASSTRPLSSTTISWMII